ncbi:MAG: hypothetical protein PHQ08_01445, partial [Candidatus Pacebacteria bacterium]|nr:hypothetical protein [Candidatus Paceibacterota bacterium]
FVLVRFWNSVSHLLCLQKEFLLDLDLCYTEVVLNKSKDFFDRRLGQFEVLRVEHTRAAI